MEMETPSSTTEMYRIISTDQLLSVSGTSRHVYQKSFCYCKACFRITHRQIRYCSHGLDPQHNQIPAFKALEYL